MKSCLESLSTEILFEICDYLTTFDILRAFIDLNHWLDAVISSYSIRLDFQFVSRSKFDFICRHIHPEQVILLILSEKTIPDQVSIVDINISFDSLERCLIQLHQLTHLIVEATGTLDLLDGARWEKLATRTQIEKFNFRLNFARGTTCNCDEKSLLEPFRSPFWLEQKRWFVAYHKQKWRHDNYLSIYTVPHFRPHSVQFPPSDYPPLSTAPAEIEQRIFYTSNIDHLFCDVVRLNLLSVHCFTKVNSLTIVGSVLPSFDNLKFIVDFDRVQNLDISGIDFLSANEFHNLVAHAGCLRHLTIKEFDPLLILPRHIYSLTIYRAVQSASINLFCHLLSHVEHLAMTVESKEIMIQLIDRLEHLETFSCSFSCKLPNLDDVSVKWLQQNTRRLKTNNFTCRIGVERIYLSIGDNW
ncbi:unnamed protein product [Rotaria magnacalcarata]|uniref:F-box domain-containing protein n=1 Tax=Rotaria magnacalcarata TaxID=392030 RepID=A0A8S2JIH6_9BILA|nr:unnamed protein product [Rotaria magnacalcarata]